MSKDLIDRGLTALSAQVGNIVPLISMLQLKKWNMIGGRQQPTKGRSQLLTHN